LACRPVALNINVNDCQITTTFFGEALRPVKRLRLPIYVPSSGKYRFGADNASALAFRRPKFIEVFAVNTGYTRRRFESRAGATQVGPDESSRQGQRIRSDFPLFGMPADIGVAEVRARNVLNSQFAKIPHPAAD
jgi:hypothetical protein